ncbi:MAG: hypothetical protein K6A82_02675 [Prevotella sp.]|nr:hypothetical protein [Prevotella sp.]
MERKKFYIAPEVEVICLHGEQLLQGLSTQHEPQVQDEYEDEVYEEEAPFGF